MPRFPPPQRPVTLYLPGLFVAGILVLTRKEPLFLTLASTAGTPAKPCLCTNAREMMKTVFPTAQPSADPLINTVFPRMTDDGVRVREGTEAVADAAASAERSAALAAAADRFTGGA
jgi:hypothetical protein